MWGPGWLNELGSWITKQLIQAYHQYGVGSRPALQITKKGSLDSQPQVIKFYTTKAGRHDIAESGVKHNK